jgi:hypothetical protein
MVDDDEPKLPLEPATPTGAPAHDKDASTPTQKPEGDEPEGDVEASDAADDEADDGAPDDDEGDEGDDDEEESDADKPKRRLSRIQRYKRIAERARAEVEALRSRTSGSLPPNEAALAQAIENRVRQEVGDPPKEADFKGDYIGFEREMQAYLADRRMATRDVRKQFSQAIQSEQASLAEAVADHRERVAKFKTKVKDFDDVMAKATLGVHPTVERLILQSKLSHRIQYHLAKNQTKLAQLNNMTSEQAAREIGRIEGRLSLPPQPKQTKAQKPIAPLKGGSTGPTSQTAAMNAWLKKQYGDRA